MKVDSAHQCVVSNAFFGCVACRTPGGCGGAPEGPCYKHVPGGEIARIPTFAAENDPAGSQSWVPCSASDQQGFAFPECE
jgi:hypothetical protein